VKQIVSTTEAAWLLELDPRSFPALARRQGVVPLGPVRVGRSTITRWRLADVQMMAGPPSPANEPAR
jgi:hypothetical protein